MRRFLLLPCLLAATSSTFAGETWNYVVDESDATDAPAACTLRLTPDPPPDLRETFEYSGQRQLYGQLVYGSPDSERVAIVIDRLGDDSDTGEFDLYVDADRDRVLRPEERVAGEGPRRRLTLPVMHIDGDPLNPRFIDRTVEFELGGAGRALRVATLGCLHGAVRLGDRLVAARRFDADGNGQFADAADRLWIDLDGDGRWDPFVEQFTCQAVLRIDGQSVALRADALGDALDLAPIEGSGRVRVVARPRIDVEVIEARALLICRDGSVVTVRAADGAARVPAGEYRVGSMFLHVADPEGGAPWSYTFSSAGQPEMPWRTVAADATLEIEPLADLRFAVALPYGKPAYMPADTVHVAPLWTSGEGLSINGCWRGDAARPYDRQTAADIELIDPDQSVAYACRSSFACGTFCKTAVRVPANASMGTFQVRVTFDSGPLAGPLEAAADVIVAP
jgi:hypothetical protein